MLHTLCRFAVVQVEFTMFNLLVSGFIYPVVTHWAWDEQGWLKHYGYVVSFSLILLIYLMTLMTVRM